MNPGANTVRIAADGYLPHLQGLVISPDAQPPSRQVFPLSAEEEEALRPQFNLAGLLRGDPSTCSKPTRADYPQGDAICARVDALDAETSGARATAGCPPKTGTQLNGRVESLRARPCWPPTRCCALSGCCSSNGTPISRATTTPTTSTAAAFRRQPVRAVAGRRHVTELVPQLAGGIFGRFDLSFDGRRVVFDYKARTGEGFRIWEVGVDGTGCGRSPFLRPTKPARIAKYKINEMYHASHRRPAALLPAGRRDLLRVDPVRAGDSLRRTGRVHHHGAVPHGRRRPEPAKCFANAGQRVVAQRDERRADPLHPLGIRRQGRRGDQVPVGDAPRRHGIGRGLRQRHRLSRHAAPRPGRPRSTTTCSWSSVLRTCRSASAR